MDSRQDEQERGITMKSSAITLYHNNPKGKLITKTFISINFCFNILCIKRKPILFDKFDRFTWPCRFFYRSLNCGKAMRWRFNID
jgi:hypothetical protein